MSRWLSILGLMFMALGAVLMTPGVRGPWRKVMYIALGALLLGFVLQLVATSLR
jgi:hypothetical protein